MVFVEMPAETSAWQGPTCTPCARFAKRPSSAQTPNAAQNVGKIDVKAYPSGRLPWPTSERSQTPVLHLTSEQPTDCVRCAAHVLLLARALDRGSAQLPGYLGDSSEVDDSSSCVGLDQHVGEDISSNPAASRSSRSSISIVSRSGVSGSSGPQRSGSGLVH